MTDDDELDRMCIPTDPILKSTVIVFMSPSTYVTALQEMEDFGELDDVLRGGPVPMLNADYD